MRDGLTYLTWYPVCLQGISTDVTPPEWPTYPAEPLRSDLAAGTLKAMAQFVPCFAHSIPANLEDVTVKGGVIVAWGQTDIYDPRSELHRRFEIGVTSTGRFHSVDPGKLTMAPYFAEVCAGRILQGHRSMSGPLVTIGVPVFQGQDDLPITLECLRTQTYANLDVLISVDAGTRTSAQACEPFLRGIRAFACRSSRRVWDGREIPTGPCANAAASSTFFNSTTIRCRQPMSPTWSRLPCAILTPRSAMRKCNPAALPARFMRGVPFTGRPVERVLTC